MRHSVFLPILATFTFLLLGETLGFGQIPTTPPAPQGAWRPPGLGTPAMPAPPAATAVPPQGVPATPAALPAPPAMGFNTGVLPAPSATIPAQPAVLQGNTPVQARPTARVTNGSGTLPSDHGQVWRDYDISPYTSRVTSGGKPEQAIVDWIIRETGTEVWFSEPLGMLSASRDTLRVYHTPEMHVVVKDIVDRFVGSQADAYSFHVRLVTVSNPNWRARAHRMMRPVSVQSPGIQAWILRKEDAAVFMADLQKRSDYREHNSAQLLIQNGQVGSLAQLRPKNYVKNVLLRADAWPGYQSEMGQIEEGYSLELSPLVAFDASTVDAVIKCHVDQVEKLVPVTIDVPTQLDPRQRVEIQVPQMVSWRVHERFRWPTDQVLVLSCGVVAKPGAGRPAATGIPVLPDFPELLSGAPPRADALMLLEARGPINASAAAAAAGTSPPVNGASPAIRTGSLNFHGRY